jgi:hypothetical protein
MSAAEPAIIALRLTGSPAWMYTALALGLLLAANLRRGIEHVA